MAERKRLTAWDWTVAAYEALAEGGAAAVAVEPLAARLGTTKGSFYWHFPGRDALLEAALLHWERTETEEVIALVEAQPDVRARLRAVLAIALGEHEDRPTGAAVELALQPTAGHPLVAPVLARVTERRLTYLTALFGELGFPPEDARHRSLLAYTSYLGHAQLTHATPAAAPSGDALRRYVDAAIGTLTSA
ncbi:TetR/AcrR family transcriptional regulator [Pseudonocardia nigra]|uniref:TetR/AcrR family transcriptional regulator n=1 Tax=Pseudonocardia nigra TaxID=1921578 RepID=UPI0027E2D5FC|nr:TetR/AcrR family transcriptional regulator [Pseudonocardia nigra]